MLTQGRHRRQHIHAWRGNFHVDVLLREASDQIGAVHCADRHDRCVARGIAGGGITGVAGSGHHQVAGSGGGGKGRFFRSRRRTATQAHAHHGPLALCRRSRGAIVDCRGEVRGVRPATGGAVEHFLYVNGQVAITVDANDTIGVVQRCNGAGDVRAVAAAVFVPVAAAGVHRAGHVRLRQVDMQALIARVDDADHDIAGGGRGLEQGVIRLHPRDAPRGALRQRVAARVGFDAFDFGAIPQTGGASIGEHGNHAPALVQAVHDNTAGGFHLGAPALYFGGAITAVFGGTLRTNLDYVTSIVERCRLLGQGCDRKGQQQRGQRALGARVHCVFPLVGCFSPDRGRSLATFIDSVEGKCVVRHAICALFIT